MTLFRDLRLDDGSPTDLRADGAGRIAEMAPGLAAPPGEPVVECGGALALPGLVDGHAHLDKTLTGLPWLPHPAGPSRRSRIETERRLRGDFALDAGERAARLLDRCIGFGTTAIRTHVDVDTEVGVASVEAIAALRERYRGRVDIQIVAFPQSGLGHGRRVLRLLDDALQAGADLLGGIDPVAVDGEIDGPLDALFELAGLREVGLDIHIHDPTANGIAEIEAIVARTVGLSLQGRVTVSHGFALGAADDATVGRVGEQLATQRIALATHGGGASPLPPVRRLSAGGVVVMAGNDGVRDTWTPFGNGDMLERAMLLAWRAGFRDDADLRLAAHCASGAGARVMGLALHGLAVGRRADFFTVAAENLPEAVVERPPRELVVKGGRVVARGGAVVG